MYKLRNKDKKTFIIAELSANHNNNWNLTVETIKAMADAGADAVKLQTYKPQSLTLDLDNGYFAPSKKGLWKGYTPWKLFEEASMPYEWQIRLQPIVKELGMEFFSTPFDKEGIDFLESLNVPYYKIASPEINDIPLIEYTASKKKPVIISTGMAEIKDIQLAIDTCRKAGNNDIVLLKCTSHYPAEIKEANLLTIPDMKNRFGLEVGVSDHTMGSIVPTVAVSLGATVVEKHFILSRKSGGADSGFSMEPDEFKSMVTSVRMAEEACGKISYEVSPKDKNERRSLFIVKDIKSGETFTEENIRSIRPGFGLPPKYFNDVLGKKANRDLKKGDPLEKEFYI